MKITLNKITPSNHLMEKISNQEDIQTMFEEFSKLDYFDSQIYVEEKITLNKYIGIDDIWIITSIKNKTIKIRANLTFNVRNSSIELYVKAFIPLNRNIKNGINSIFKKVENPQDLRVFLDTIDILKGTPNFVQEFNETEEIIEAIELYKNITSQMDKRSEQSFLMSNFAIEYGYSIDASIAKTLSINVLKCKKNWYIYDEDKTNVPEKHIGKEVIKIWTIQKPTHVEPDLSITLNSIIRDSGLLTISAKKDDWGTDEKNIKIIDYSIKKTENGKSILTIITENDSTYDDKTESLYFVIYDKLRFKKRKTMLDVVDDIKKNRINNNNLFQYLFNNGSFNNVGLLKDWDVDEDIADDFIQNLHEKQADAFGLAIDEHPITFIQGPPGTGKTHIITQICKYYNLLEKKVLVSSQTNVAVENILENLWGDESFQGLSLKADYKSSLYSDANIRTLIATKIKNILDINSEIECIKDIELHKIISEAIVVGATTTTSALDKRLWESFYKKYDVLIVDEISKSSVPELIRYVINSKKIIFVGDQRQLAPLDEIDQYDSIWDQYSTKDKNIIKKYISVSIFDKLFNDMKLHGRAVMLDENQRSLPIITNTYSYFYKNDEHVNGLKPLRSPNSSKILWKKGVLPMCPFTFIGMNGGSEKIAQNKSRYNLPEAKFVNELLEELVKSIENTSDLTVAIISFYGAQIQEILNHTPINEYKKLFKNIKVDTVDAFQGDQADIVILSTVRETKTLSTGFIDDYRRLNVSISRAKDLVIMLGNDHLLRDIPLKIDNVQVSYYKILFDYLKKIDEKKSSFQNAFTFRKVG